MCSPDSERAAREVQWANHQSCAARPCMLQLIHAYVLVRCPAGRVTVADFLFNGFANLLVYLKHTCTSSVTHSCGASCITASCDASRLGRSTLSAAQPS